MTHLVAEDIGPATLTMVTAILLGGTLHLAALQPEVARVLIGTGLNRHLGTYPTVRAAIADRRPGIRTAPPSTGPAVIPASAVPVQAKAGPGADSGELRAAVFAGCSPLGRGWP